MRPLQGRAPTFGPAMRRSWTGSGRPAAPPGAVGISYARYRGQITEVTPWATGASVEPDDLSLWRAGCGGTHTSGSAGGPRKRTRPKGRNRASVRPDHFYASLLIHHGESVKVIQARLGHNTLQRRSTATATSGPTPRTAPVAPSTRLQRQFSRCPFFCGQGTDKERFRTVKNAGHKG